MLYYKMSDTQFTNVQRRIMNLYENGHIMETDQLQRAIDGLIGSATHMVKLRKSETKDADVSVKNFVSELDKNSL